MRKNQWLVGGALGVGLAYVLASQITLQAAQRRAAEPICLHMELGYGKLTGSPYSEARYRACIDRESASRPCRVNWLLSASCSDFS